MTDFIGTLAPTRTGNWAICRQEGLWGIVARGSNWRTNAERVRSGDSIFVWRGGPPNNGFIAELKTLGAWQPVTAQTLVPWPDPELFGAVIPVSIELELGRPMGDTFANRGRRGVRFGFNNTVLQHSFEEVDGHVAQRIRYAFRKELVGQRFKSPVPPSGIQRSLPFEVDPDRVDRGLMGHHKTVERLACWVRDRGYQPLLPGPQDPQFDLAWWTQGGLEVAEVKSISETNEESQLRLGLGQVLRYRHHLRRRVTTVNAWLVPERLPRDSTWRETCLEVGVRLLVP